MIRAATKREVYDFFRRAVDTLYRGITPMLFDTERLDACDECYVAEIDGQIIGAVTLAYAAENGPTLDTLFVWEDQQNRGIGTSLCAKATQRLIEAGKTPIYCEVNTRAMHVTIKRLPQEQQSQFRLNLVYEREGDLEMPNALHYLLDLLQDPPADGSD